MKRLLLGIVLLLSSIWCNSADVKMTIVQDPASGSQTTPQATPANSKDSVTIYVQGASQRVEFQGIIAPQPQWRFRHLQQFLDLQPAAPRIAVITHCDTGIIDELNLDYGTYREFKGPRYPSEEKFRKMVEDARKTTEKLMLTSTADTGESRDFFGHITRHKVTTITQKHAGRRVSSNQIHKGVVYTEIAAYKEIDYQETIDGWYVDLPQPGCAPNYVRAGVAAPASFVHSCDGYNCDELPESDSRGVGGVELNGWKNFFYAYPFMPGPEDASVPLGIRGVTLFQTGPNSTVSENSYLIYTGFLPSGLPVAQKTSGEITLFKTSHGKSRKEMETPWGYAVTEYSESPLDPALFTVPPGFKKMK
jgi:hypothetical protein